MQFVRRGEPQGDNFVSCVRSYGGAQNFPRQAVAQAPITTQQLIGRQKRIKRIGRGFSWLFGLAGAVACDRFRSGLVSLLCRP